MKNYPIVLLVLYLCSISHLLHASPINTNYLSTELSMGEKDAQAAIEHLLVSNVWYQSNQRLLFSKTGMVSIIEADSEALHSKSWRLESNDGSILLHMFDKKCEELVYRIEKNGNTYQWINSLTNLPIEINAAPFAMKAELLKTYRSLVGTWRSSIFPSTVIENLKGHKGKTVKNADFTYVLKTDGAFTKTIYVNGEEHFAANGFWQLSDDHKQLILHFQQKDCSYLTRSVEIKLIALDELVLGQNISISNLEQKICEERKTFFYSKQ
ncbi:MAG: hypothetical protein AAGI49_03325 [Bacteroidota bacterium]